MDAICVHKRLQELCSEFKEEKPISIAILLEEFQLKKEELMPSLLTLNNLRFITIQNEDIKVTTSGKMANFD
jgi:hypothetical protein